MGGRVGRRGRSAEELAFVLVREHACELLRFARRFSLCTDDAQDAYQRALEKLVRQLRSGQAPARTLPWLRTVLRHECSQVREERQRSLSREPLDVDAQPADAVEDPAERVERFERLTHAAEALRGLKPQEVTALVLRAEGLSYQEICERTSWTYTRTNRAITEGRRALRMRLKAIESGEACERWVPLLSLLADGEASARELSELRPHLRSCPGCRATLRGFHDAPRQLHELVPVAVLPVAAGAGGESTLRQAETVVQWLLERAGMSAMRMQGAIDALPGAKFAAVAASTAAVAGGGAAIERAATAEPARPPAAAVQTADRSPADATTVAATPPDLAPSPAAVAPGPDAASMPSPEPESDDASADLPQLAEFALETPLGDAADQTLAARDGTPEYAPSDRVHGDAPAFDKPTAASAESPTTAPDRTRADDAARRDRAGGAADRPEQSSSTTASSSASPPAASQSAPVFTPSSPPPDPAPTQPTPPASSAPSEFGGF